MSVLPSWSRGLSGHLGLSAASRAAAVLHCRCFLVSCHPWHRLHKRGLLACRAPPPRRRLVFLKALGPLTVSAISISVMSAWRLYEPTPERPWSIAQVGHVPPGMWGAQCEGVCHTCAFEVVGICPSFYPPTACRPAPPHSRLVAAAARAGCAAGPGRPHLPSGA